MFENIANFFRKLMKSEKKEPGSRDAAKERLHLVLMQDRANVSADFLELMKQEIIDVIKKYIEVDEKEIDVRLTNKENEDGTNGAPALYANIPILNIRNEMKKEVMTEKQVENTETENNEEVGESIARPEEMQQNQSKEETKQENADVEVSIACPEEIQENQNNEEMKQDNADVETSIARPEEVQENQNNEETKQENIENIEEQSIETVNVQPEVVNQTNNI